MIPLSSVVSYTTSGVASTLNRYNRVRSMILSANLQDGLSLNQALTYLNKLTRATLPPEAIIDYKGQSRDFQNSSNAFIRYLFWVF